MFLLLFEKPLLNPNFLETQHISECLLVVASPVLIEFLQWRTGKVAAFAAIEQALFDSTRPRRAVIDEFFLVPASHAIHLFLEVPTTSTEESAESQLLMWSHLPLISLKSI
jgi:hypothetical protein